MSMGDASYCAFEPGASASCSFTDSVASEYGFWMMPVFRLFPKTREEWLSAFVFVFRAYVVVGLIVCWFVSSFWVHSKTGTWHWKTKLACFYDFEERVMIGYAICLVVLAYSGVADLIIGRWRSGLLNLFLAAITAWVMFTTSFAIS